MLNRSSIYDYDLDRPDSIGDLQEPYWTESKRPLRSETARLGPGRAVCTRSASMPRTICCEGRAVNIHMLKSTIGSPGAGSGACSVVDAAE